jgi:hypothetical protein
MLFLFSNDRCCGDFIREAHSYSDVGDDMMKIGKNMIRAIMITFCFTVMLFVTVPIRSATNTYNPWLDFNDDGKIGLTDLVQLANSLVQLRNSYGTNGAPTVKAALLYDSGWLNLTGNSQNYTVYHNLNLTNLDNIIVDASQRASSEWSKTYDKTDGDHAWSVVQAKDGGYALAGQSGSEYWLVKTDADGNMQWNKTYGTIGNDMEVCSVVQTSDGGYALAGSAPSHGANHDFWLVKTDADGNMQWNQTYGTTENDDDVAFSIVQTRDGGYALAGGINPNSDPKTARAGGRLLMKTDASGNLQWYQTYGEKGTDYAACVIQTDDGGYALAGPTTSNPANSSDFWLVKTDANGKMQWNQTYGGTLDNYAMSMVQTSDGGYALAGQKLLGGFGIETVALFVKTDGAGNELWEKTYGGTDAYYRANSMVQTSDGGYALAGWTRAFNSSNDDLWLAKLSGTFGGTSGCAWAASSPNSIALYRGTADPYWYVRVQIWQGRTP